MNKESVVDAMIKAREAMEAAGITVEWLEDGNGNLYLTTNVSADDVA